MKLAHKVDQSETEFIKEKLDNLINLRNNEVRRLNSIVTENLACILEMKNSLSGFEHFDSSVENSLRHKKLKLQTLSFDVETKAKVFIRESCFFLLDRRILLELLREDKTKELYLWIKFDIDELFVFTLLSKMEEFVNK